MHGSAKGQKKKKKKKKKGRGEKQQKIKEEEKEESPLAASYSKSFMQRWVVAPQASFMAAGNAR